MEAIAFGLPVITCPVGGLKEFIKEGNMGSFCLPKDYKSLADKTISLLQNKTLLEGSQLIIIIMLKIKYLIQM